MNTVTTKSGPKKYPKTRKKYFIGGEKGAETKKKKKDSYAKYEMLPNEKLIGRTRWLLDCEMVA